MLRRLVLAIAASALFATTPPHGAEWPQFRGPDANSQSSAADLPSEWGPDQNLAWKVAVPGRGWSSPIVWGDKVFVTTAVEEQAPSTVDRRLAGGVYRWEVHCLDLASGKTLWTQVAVQGKPSIATHTANTYASETPVTDGELVYVYFGMMGLFAYDLDGKLVWKKDLGTYKMRGDWGTSTSPLLYDGKLYMQIDSEDDSFLAALDSKTGDELWRIARDEVSSWSTPMIWKNELRTELITSAKHIRSYDPADGKLLWEMSVGGGRSSASPTVADGLLYLGSETRQDGGGFLFAIKPGASGDITPAEGETTSSGVVWSRAKAGPPMSSPLVVDGLVYILERRNGIVTTYDAKTGEQVYKNRLEGAQAFWATPWAYGGKIFLLDDTGTTHVIQPGREFEVLTKNSFDEQFWASAAIADGSLILRGAGHLYCIRE